LIPCRRSDASARGNAGLLAEYFDSERIFVRAAPEFLSQIPKILGRA
jgi:hypothetical protein